MNLAQIAAQWHYKLALSRYKFNNDVFDAETARVANLFEEYAYDTIPCPVPLPEDTDEDISEYNAHKSREEWLDKWSEGSQDESKEDY